MYEAITSGAGRFFKYLYPKIYTKHNNPNAYSKATREKIQLVGRFISNPIIINLISLLAVSIIIYTTAPL